MIIQCPNCSSKYQYAEDRFERKPSKKIKCAKCQTIFEIHNPAFEESAPAATSDDSGTGRRIVLDETRNARVRHTEPENTAQSVPIPQGPDTGPQPLGPKLPVGKRLSLAIIDGPDSGSVFRIEKPRVTIGRANADLTLKDSEASRQHAAIEVRDSICLLEDLGSTNGTLLNGTRIEEQTELQDKAEFQVGGTTLMLIIADDTSTLA